MLSTRFLYIAAKIAMIPIAPNVDIWDNSIYAAYHARLLLLM
jgi:hypothetical protein